MRRAIGRPSTLASSGGGNVADSVDDSHLAYLNAKLKGELTEEEFKGVHLALSQAVDDLCKSPFRDGFQAPPLFELYHRELTQTYGENQWKDTKIRRATMMRRDITTLLHKQIAERRRYGGNMVLEFAGATGGGKSSCMLGLMERHNGLREVVEAGGVEALRGHLSIDLSELPAKLEHLKSGQAIAMDEQLHLVGEGAETAYKLLRNVEDTLRGTMIDLYFVSPGKRDNHDASQGYLEALSQSPIQLRDGRPGRRMTRFLYHIALGGLDPLPLGVVDLPWCGPTVFAAYDVIKKENLERTRRAQFTAAAAVNVEVVKRIFEAQGFQARLRHNLRPTKTDLKRYVRAYAGTSISISEQDTIASEIAEMLDVLRDSKEDFPTIWAFEPTAAMLKVATHTDDKKGIRHF